LGLVYHPKQDSVGVNRSSFATWAAKFNSLGYKVTRVDQINTAVTAEEKKKKASSKKPELRGVAETITSGTIRNIDYLEDKVARYLLAIYEEIKEDQSPQFGICFLDATTNNFGLCSFIDDDRYTKLETILLQLKPKEILFQKVIINLYSLK